VSAIPDAVVEAGREFVLTVSCADRRGIVHAVSGVMLELSMTIRDSQQFADTSAGEFHLRMHLAREGAPLPVAALEAAMAGVATQFAMTYAAHDLSQRRRVLVMVSQQGHCLNDLLFRVESGSLPIEVPAIVSNHEDFRALAQWHGVPFHHVPVAPETKAAAEAQLRRLVDEHQADTIVLARYMQILSAQLCADFAGRIINIHHSLLPSFKGAKPYSQAHDRGVKVIGATAHYVTADLDEGPIIEQDFRRVDHRMSPSELASVGQELEAMALARAVRWHAEHRVVLRGRRTIVFD
jgi:formyltetrahydrofolate deformylase